MDSLSERQREREREREGGRERERRVEEEGDRESQTDSALLAQTLWGSNTGTVRSSPELKPRVGCLTN